MASWGDTRAIDVLVGKLFICLANDYRGPSGSTEILIATVAHAGKPDSVCASALRDTPLDRGYMNGKRRRLYSSSAPFMLA
jgi:hypothetical protein